MLQILQIAIYRVQATVLVNVDSWQKLYFFKNKPNKMTHMLLQEEYDIQTPGMMTPDLYAFSSVLVAKNIMSGLPAYEAAFMIFQ